MQPTITNVLDAALSLPLEHWLEVVAKLLESIEEEDKKIDAAWLEEAQRRLREFDEGRMDAIDADEVFRSLRSRERK